MTDPSPSVGWIGLGAMGGPMATCLAAAGLPVIAFDIDPAKATKQWFVEGLGFGVRHLRDLRIQWTNIGKTVAQGSSRTISGTCVRSL